jgi:hypothetical protein
VSETGLEARALGSAGGWRLVAIAASISVVFLAAAVLLLRKPGDAIPSVVEQGLSERVAAEVVRRHGRCVEEIDFRADDLPKLLAQMEKVDFVPSVPLRKELGSMKVKGAHYCVLDGQIAIHVVLVDDSGALVSLFETKAGTEMASFRGASHRVGRMDVEIWQDRGVLFAAALPTPTT